MASASVTRSTRDRPPHVRAARDERPTRDPEYARNLRSDPRPDSPIPVGCTESILLTVQRQRQQVRALIEDVATIGDRQFGSRPEPSTGVASDGEKRDPAGFIGVLHLEQELLDNDIKELGYLIDRLKAL